jgi:hypothetical protein
LDWVVATGGGSTFGQKLPLKWVYDIRADSTTPLQQAEQICKEVYADSDDIGGYSNCISSATRSLEKH